MRVGADASGDVLVTYAATAAADPTSAPGSADILAWPGSRSSAPHRPGRAELPHPVLHERDSLAVAYPWKILAGGRGWRFIDGVTAEDYEANLEANLLDLLERIKSGRYRAPPVRRAYIPKADGSQRMLGIPTFEDKVAQRVVTMMLEAVYEQDFLPCSYGFRPGRSAHQALRTLQNVLWAKRLYWVIDIDIRKYFDSIPHSHLRTFLDQRVTDGVIRRMIDKWLKAGAVEDGLLRRTTEGSPQGGVISPCLSNVFLHYVLDEWFETEARPRLKGESTLARFADDAIMAFDNIVDAKRVLAVLGKRLARFGLTLHPDKTRLVDFRLRITTSRPTSEVVRNLCRSSGSL